MKRLCLAALFAALIAIGWPTPPVQAQGCGPQNPNCIVTTMPLNDASRRAASDQFVQNALAAFVPSAPCAICAVTNAANTFLAPQTSQGLTTTQPGWYAQLTGDSNARVRVGLNSTDIPSLAFGPGNAVRDAFLERLGAASLRFGAPDAAAPVAQTLGVQNVVVGTSNTSGADWNFHGSIGTGTGVGGAINFLVAPAASSGSLQNSFIAALGIKGSGNVTIGPNTSIAAATNPARLTVGLNAAAAPDTGNAWGNGTNGVAVAQFVGVDGKNAALIVSSFGSGEAALHLTNSGGTAASQTATTLGTHIATANWDGCYLVTGVCTYQQGAVWLGRSLDNWLPTATGTILDAYTTPAGTATITHTVSIGSGLMVGVFTDEGVGTVNATQYFAGSTAGLATKTCTINNTTVGTGVTLTIKGGIITGTTTC